MKHYKLRIDTEDRDKVLQLLKRYSTRYLVCIENIGTENTHTHSFFSTDKENRTIRAYIRKSFGKGNGTYSMKELDEEFPIEYLAYCVKENNYITTFTSEEIQKIKELDLKIKSEIKQKKKDKLPVWKKILELIKEENQDWRKPKHEDLRYERVFRSVLQYHKENELLIRRFQIQSYSDTICLHLLPDGEEFIIQKII